MYKRISRISKWLITVTRSVLRPLLWSTICRQLYFFAHLGILALGAGMVSTLFTNSLTSGAHNNTGTASFPVPLWLAIVMLIFFTLLKALFNYFEHFLGHLVAFKALEILRVEFYRAMLPIATENSRKSGDLLLRATKDIDRIEVFFAHTFAPAVTAITTPLIILLICIPFLGWQVTLFAALGLGLSIFVIPTLGITKAFASARAASTARAELTQHVTDSIQGIAEVTGYGHTKKRLRQMRQLDQNLATQLRPRNTWTTVRNAVAIFISLFTTLGVAVIGVTLSLPPIALTVFTVLTWGLFGVTAGVRDFAADLDNSLAAAERVYDIAQLPAQVTSPAIPTALPNGALSIGLENVSYRYPNSVQGTPPALADVSFQAPAGSHTCLIGLSGCGKSTILKLLARHFDPTQGAVKIGAVHANQIDLTQLRARVVLVEQNAVLFNASVAENLRLAAPEASDTQLLAALEVVELHTELAPRGGLALQIGDGGNLLSGGQRQRLALARAILRRPSMLLLDEYTSHLDHQTAANVRKNLRRALPKLTIVESTHSPASLTDADYVVVIDNGKIQAQGTLAQVKNSAALAQLMARETKIFQ